jgi:hypothetical protein
MCVMNTGFTMYSFEDKVMKQSPGLYGQLIDHVSLAILLNSSNLS